MRIFWVFAVLALALGAGVSLALLTVLHSILASVAGMRFDHAVQLAVHDWTQPALTAGMRALTWIGSVKVFGSGLVGALAVLLRQRKRHAAYLLGLAMLGALLLNETLKVHFHRARPTVPWAIGDEHTFSFPSGHSLFAVVLYGLVAYLLVQRDVSLALKVASVTLAVGMPLAIGLSRIYLGMHYPTDVLAGYLAGVIWLHAVMGVDVALRLSRRPRQ